MPSWLPPLLALLPAHLQGLAAGLGYQGFCGTLLASLGRRAYGGEAEAWFYEGVLLGGLILQGGLGYTLVFLLWVAPEVLEGWLGGLLTGASRLLALGLALFYLASRLTGLPLPSPYGFLWGGRADWDALGVFLALWEILVYWAFSRR
ncbi:hypothetical protein GCM10007092_14680 [Thermus composti]|uniref:DUF4345 domain-containing protein n=1 Tax=Thermus composti TaxID=532059 RepID=A0ABV6PYK4_9DEIN|nr:hypothetical protein [Thermus composti]GGN01606.1 hypothetical protein GCM10007092_14680 [Thermus composti]